MKKLLKIKADYTQKLEEQNGLSEIENQKKLDNMMFNEFDMMLVDEKPFPQFLREPYIAEIVKHVLHYNNKKLYNLLCYSIMPNHIHVLVSPVKQETGDYILLPELLKTWKGISARLINKKLNRKGKLWQDESYDHVVRQEEEFHRIVEYIINNPVKAGLVENWKDWQFTYVTEELMSLSD